MREHWSTETTLEPTPVITAPSERPKRLSTGVRHLAARREAPVRERDTDESYSERELLARYLREAGKIPLLTPAAEVELFRQLEEGEGCERQEARATLIAANLRLVVGVARHYVGLGLSLPELIAEGNLGLIAAVDRFERARGYRFSTFARWPIRKAITRSLDDRARLVRLPANSWQALRELRRAEETLPDTLGREPTSAELATACKVAIWRFDALRVAAATPISIDTPARGGNPDDAEETTLGETLEGPERSLPALVGNHVACDQLGALLDTLAPRERILLVLRHGLDGGAPRTLQQVGEALGISGERTRQLEARALEQLRAHPLVAALRDALE